jgi:DNA replication protein DnaC
METKMLLETYLKQLRLPTFAQNYAQFAQDAAQSDLGYDRFLLALAEQEVLRREENQRHRRIKSAKFPVLKELADFDFSCISGPSKQRVLDLARGEYIGKAGSIIMVGHPGLGKSHVATGLSFSLKTNITCPSSWLRLSDTNSLSLTSWALSLFPPPARNSSSSSVQLCMSASL